MTYTKDNIQFVEKPANSRFKDLTGIVFGRLTVLGFAGRHNSPRLPRQWFCECLCGRIVCVLATHLAQGRTKSCGCLRTELLTARKTRHGMVSTPEYIAYISAKMRCVNKKVECYSRYGGRGIEFRFASFEEFFAELGSRPSADYSVDRQNNDGHYEPGNVHWATTEQQSRNRRNNRLITIDSRTLILSEWAKIYGVNPKRVRNRINRLRWCGPCSLTKPIGGSCPHR